MVKICLRKSTEKWEYDLPKKMRKQGGAWTRETTDFYNTKLVLRTEKISFPSFLGTLFNSELCRGGKQKDPPRARKQRYNLFICDLSKKRIPTSACRDLAV